ncbi:MAG: hypothetical protein J6U40_04955, partial [Kiritimatiellae bacterium]|nr:hypothetical protein [Kiritimatiellia bacterium]
FTYPVPAALKTAGTYFRFFLVQTDNLPYSAEVASLSSNGGQCVRVGYTPGPDTTVEFHCGNVSYVNATAFFGQAWQGNAYLFNQQSNKFYFHGSGIAMDPVAAGTDYGCYVRSDESLVLQAGDATSGYAISRNACPFIDLTVFSCYTVTRGSSFRFDSMRVKDDGLLVRDLVPVVANGKGALFDRMTGVCWFNATGSDFSKGTTIGRQGWPLSSTASLVVAADGSFADPYMPAFVKLTEDTDWTDCQERLANGVTVDLNGYTLHLSAPETRSPASPIVIAGSGTFHLTVPKGQTWNAGTLQYDGNITILKDGEGSYLVSRKIAAVSAITIAEGEVKMGNNAVLAGGTHITVKDGATCDMAGRGDNVAFVTIEGTGPDGKGALRNTGGDISNSTAQMAGFELTGDATVYGTGHLGLINSSYNPTTFELNGHTLTLDLTAGRGFWFCNTTGTSGGTVYTKSGIPYFHRTTVNIPNVDFIIDGQNSIFRMPTETMANPTTVKSVTVMNGGLFEEGYQATHMENLTILDGGAVGLSTYVRWIYVKNEVVVSNETTDVTIYPPVTGDGTYPKLIKKGAGTLTLANNHTDQRFDRGVEIFGGTVVMSSTASTLNYHVAISSQPVPVTIHAGGTLDMRQCTQPFALSSLTIEEGGTLLHTAANTISFRSANTFTEPKPFAFAGTVNFTQPPTFVLDDLFAGPDAPAAGASVTLLEAGAITANNGVTFKVMGCPYAYDLDILPASVTLKTSAGGTAPTPITIWTVGGNYVYGNATTGDNFRFPLARLLTQERWNVKMTGWRTASGNGLQAGSVAWGHHCGIQDLALKTSPARAGLLEGLDSYALAAGDPDFTILVCGELDVADGISNGE